MELDDYDRNDASTSRDAVETAIRMARESRRDNLIWAEKKTDSTGRKIVPWAFVDLIESSNR